MPETTSRLRLEVGSLNDRTIAAVLTTVARHPPFHAYAFGLMVHNLMNQLRHGANVMAIQNGQLVAYAGWLRVHRESARLWQAGERSIPPEDWERGDAAIVTVVVSQGPGFLAPLLRGVSHRCAGVPVYRMRCFQDGRPDMRRPPIVGRPQVFA
ncbi:hypothetical protein OOT46_12395 [Aquabacterium sp. A7-Y]|uniref:hypothetical protein n=1 Tax=Aquabacterium sp. A7-Y TaxID=1349605 RepID=UPI00223E65DF|nr:hypothetical protein [Aquabacterium sp. A7-Y]MCW7538643.1 hypothetical protein [Aquabacterium sp. A7-Y]